MLTASSSPRRSLRLDPARTAAILDLLEQRDAAEKTTAGRFPYRHAALRIEFTALPPHAVAAPTRWINAQGLGFLHGCLLYSGASCRVTLLSLHGRTETVAGTITQCQYVGPHVYDVAIAFKEPLDPTRFAGAATRTRSLLVSDDDMTTRLLTVLLERMNAEVVAVRPEQADAGPEIGKQRDIVLLDLDAHYITDFIERTELRVGASTAELVGLSADGQAHQAELAAGGLDNLLTKPIQPDELTAVVKSLRREPIVSTLAGNPECAGVVTDFVGLLGDYVERIRRSLASDERDELMQLVRQLGRQSRICGFDPIAKQVEVIERETAAGRPIAQSWGLMRQLFRACGHVRAPDRPASGPPAQA